MKVIELQDNILVELSKEIWDTLPEPDEHVNGVSIMNLLTLPNHYIKQAQEQLNFLSGKVAAFIMEPNTVAPIHIDNHENNDYHHSLNILIEDNNGNHKTFYYSVKEYTDTLYSMTYDENDTNIKRIFEMTVKKPTIFNNQQFHNIENYSGNNRLLLMWEIHKNYKIEDIVKWLNDNNIKYEVLF